MSYIQAMKKSRILTASELSEQKHFDVMAKKYDTNYTYNTPFTQYKIQKKLRILFKSIKPSQKLRILEIGAGTGEYTQHLAAFFPESKITAIDISPKILKVAEKKCKKFSNVTFEVASAYDLPYKKNEFDLVCGFYILHHIDPVASLQEAHRVLKKGGLAAFYEPNLLNPVVFAIKSIPWLKKRVGDSPEEWAINPLSLNTGFAGFPEVKYMPTEFIAVPGSLSLVLAVAIDKLTSLLSYVPVVRLLGGSLAIILRK